MKKTNILKSIIFLLILGLFLHGASMISIRMDRNIKKIYNHSATCLYEEPDHSIDVLAIGDSSTYSAVSPLVWWENYGFTGYAWGEPSQRICETHECLKRIYKHQAPAVVFLEADNIFRDKSDADNLNSIVKAKISDVFPIVTYHKSLDPHRLPNLTADGHSLTKGYYVRTGKKKTHRKRKWIEVTQEEQPIHPISRWELKKCIKLCQKNGSAVILFSVPSRKGWNYKKHNSIEKEAEKNHVPYLDLNLALAHDMDWNQDSADGGEHLNVYGAKKATCYLGNYLMDHYALPDHRSDNTYSRWNSDLQEYNTILSSPDLLPEDEN